jgi:hypothetical protein
MPNIEVNLDGMDVSELREFARVMPMLGSYANFKADAMEARAQGNINVALTIEKMLDVKFNNLPTWARW